MSYSAAFSLGILTTLFCQLITIGIVIWWDESRSRRRREVRRQRVADIQSVR